MEVETFVRQLSSFLAPFLSCLLKQQTYDLKPDTHDAAAWETASKLWNRLGPRAWKRKGLDEAVHDAALSPLDPDALACLRVQLKKLLSADQALTEELVSIWQESEIGPGGIISPDPGNWLDKLSKDDPVLRRLEMIRLVRSGTPSDLVAMEYGALPEYIRRIDDQFSENGVAGILTEEDFLKYRSIHPETVGICTFNLHGMHDNSPQRLKRIARLMSDFNPALCAFQEVISGPEVKDTGAVISEWMTKMTGSQFRSYFAYCHPFMEKYPEGVSVAARYPFRNTHILDLNENLWKGLRPLMDRYAAVAEVEIYGRRFVFASVHLDHAEDPEIRLAQAMKLLSGLTTLYSKDTYDCLILAGDFNDVEDSPAIEFLKKEGFRDTFRECHSGEGYTYTAADPHKRIDFILVRGDVSIQSSRLVPDSPELSDHKGVLTLIK